MRRTALAPLLLSLALPWPLSGCGDEPSEQASPTPRGSGGLPAAAPLPSLPEVRLVDGTWEWTDLEGDARQAAAVGPRGLTIEIPGTDTTDRPLELRFQVASAIPATERPSRFQRQVTDPETPGPPLRLSLDATPQADLVPTAASWRTVTIPLKGATDTELKVHIEGEAEAGQITWISEPWIAFREPSETQRPRTVLLITSDTHRADHVSSINAQSPVATPYLDALAGEGAVFTNCFTSINNTNPSHIALMTGLHPRDVKIINNNTPLSGKADTLAERFRAEGYQCYAALSAFHLFDEMSGLGQGFHRMNARFETHRSGPETLDLAEAWLADAGDAPVFLWVHLFDVHTPYRLHPDQKDALLEGRADPYREDSDLGIPEARQPGWLRNSGVRDASFVHELYAGEVKFLDGHLGPFFESPRVEDALIAFTADHGEGLGEQSTYWAHFGVLTSTIHVPLILRGPGVEPGQRVDGPVKMIDVGKTLLRMAGVGDRDFPGQDARELFAGARPLEPRYALAAHGICASVEVDGWLLQMFLKNGLNKSSGRVHPVGSLTLFHLEEDPRCETNVLLEDFERATRMRAALIEWLGSSVAMGLNGANIELTVEQEAKLKELGYSGGAESAMRWWAPEYADLEWESNPWHLAFQVEGHKELLEGLLEPQFESVTK